MELTGKTAIVTGASGGLGGEIAAGLAGAGMDVVCCYHSNSQRAEEVASRVRKAGRKAVTVRADLCTDGAAARLMAEAAEAAQGAGLGPIRVLVNSAALFGRMPVGTIEKEKAGKMLELDLLVPILLVQEFSKLAGAEGGKVVNIADVGGEKVWREYSVYCAAKAGLIAATKALAKELAPRMTVNAVAPGLVTWPEGIDEAGKKRQLGFIPAGRIAQPAEIVAAVIFLLQNDYITGQVINVDGGRTI